MRREKIRNMLVKKHKFIKHIRDFMDNAGFTEITTPILANSSPEGARDFLVNS
jgi:aspartyl-tRNA synthetase